MKIYGHGICVCCGTKFPYTAKHHKPTRSRKGKLYCSTNCQRTTQVQKYASDRVQVTCAVCGKQEAVSKSKSKRYKTCSMFCLGTWQSQKLKGKKKPLEWHVKQKIAKRRENVRVIGHYPCGDCSKEFNSNTSLRAHRTHCQKGQSQGIFQCDLCGKQFTTKNGLGVHRRWHNRTQEELNKIGSNIRQGLADSQIQRPNVSAAEIEFIDELEKAIGKEIKRSYKMPGYYHEYDGFLVSENLLIEFDGDYWHGNESLYDLTPRMKSQRYKDWQHNVKALEEGYNIIRVYQSNSRTLLKEIKEHGTISKNQINQEKYQRDPSIRPSDQEES